MSTSRAGRLGWYARRAAKMSPAEMAWRARDHALKVIWSGRQVSRAQAAASVRPAPGALAFGAVLPARTADSVPDEARKAILAAADQLMRGEWQVLGVRRDDMVQPDWFRDPVTGRHAPAERYAFRINHRSESESGNVKQIWEVSRLQHLTLLAAAWFVSHDEAYAGRVAEHLRSWWQENPFLSGVNWTSAIEVGLRLISMTWIRRLLDEWPPAADLFERNGVALRQIRWHQQYLAAFPSRGSSANNHVIAEAAGQLVACCAFPWFAETEGWRLTSARLLEDELARNTFPSGINRELASDYQAFVTELGLLAAVEAEAAGHPLGAVTWQRLSAMADSGAALLDESGRPPRQGDGDEGRALLLDAPDSNRWLSLLALAAAALGGLDWWPGTQPDAGSTIIAAMPATRPVVGDRPARRPWRFADAGTILLRTTSGHDPEIWCRCDGGPHGYLSIAAHAHADALSVEVRYGGVDILADPGTYCYHGEAEWRSYFRSTIAHNTIELDGQSQSSQGGSFLWLRHANAREIQVLDVGDAAEWTADHDGYLSSPGPVRHRRCVRLDRASRGLDIVDELSASGHDIRLAFHLGPEVSAELDGNYAELRWPQAAAPGAACLELPAGLRWTLHRGETDPILGWYSAGLGRRVPAFALVGHGTSAADTPICTRLQFLDVGKAANSQAHRQVVRWGASGAVRHGNRRATMEVE